MARLIVALALVALPAFADLAVDVSQLITTFNCIHASGFNSAIVRGYQSSGNVDPNAVANIKNANSVGMDFVDVSLFPCVPCGNPAGQATTLVNALKGQSYKKIWVYVEVYSWSTNQTSNQVFITTLVNQLKTMNQVVGIYTSPYYWQKIVGIDWTGCSTLPLWYSHNDGNPSFNDYAPFGGWINPTMKQYADSKSVCSTGVNLNYYN